MIASPGRSGNNEMRDLVVFIPQADVRGWAFARRVRILADGALLQEQNRSVLGQFCNQEALVWLRAKVILRKFCFVGG